MPAETRTVRMSPLISEGKFKTGQREYAPYGESPLVFRDMTEVFGGDMQHKVVEQLQGRASLIEAAVSSLREKEESLTATYERLSLATDKKRDQAGLYRYLSVGDPGKVMYDNVANFTAGEKAISSARSREWDNKFPGTLNIFAEEIALFNAGFWPKGFRVVNSEERYVVDVPMKINDMPDIRDEGKGIISGCWASGDTEVTGIHAIEDDCSFVYNLQFEEARKIDLPNGYIWLTEPKVQVLDLSEE